MIECSVFFDFRGLKHVELNNSIGIMSPNSFNMCEELKNILIPLKFKEHDYANFHKIILDAKKFYSAPMYV